jgi:hypothetical protein
MNVQTLMIAELPVVKPRFSEMGARVVWVYDGPDRRVVERRALACAHEARVPEGMHSKV